MKELNGRELAGFVKERQARVVREMRAEGRRTPKLVIIRDSDNPVITKYVELKRRYGEDIGVEVEDQLVRDAAEAREVILKANKDASVSGMIVQLPLKDTAETDEVVSLIAPEKDVDGLGTEARREVGVNSMTGEAGPDARKVRFDSATAINWLLAGNGIELKGQRVALVGYGRLVGRPLYRMLADSGVDVTVFRHDSDLTKLAEYDTIITATGVPRLILDSMVKPGAVVVDAGTASEGGVLVGDVDESVRQRADLAAITPVVGGVGPLTVSVLFENVIAAAAAA